MNCKDCIHSGLCYKENDYENFPDRCGSFIPERPQGDLISRSELKKAFDKLWGCDDIPTTVVEDLIDNAPPEPQVTVFAENASKEEIDNFKQELENVLERPQDCSDCKRYDFPYFEVKFDKEQMQELVDKAKEKVLARIVRGEWIPIKTRPMNDEEKKKANEYFGVPYEDLNWPDAWHYDCQLPEVKDDECVDVLVTTKEGYVVVTSYSKDCFGSASFENVEYPDDITAWAYMPEPYEKEGESDADS